MAKRYDLCFAILMVVNMFVYGGSEACTIEIPELHGQTIQANYFTTLTYDFSEYVGKSQEISRLIISISGSFTPGTGFADGEYGTLDGSEMMIQPFDGYLHLGKLVQFSDESSVFSVKLDSEEMQGIYLAGIWDAPYPGYSGERSGSIDFNFGQGQTLSMIIDTWPAIEINEATYTIYLVPEPASVLIFSVGVLFLRRKGRKF